MMRLMEADQIKFDQIHDLVKTAASRLMIRCRTSVNAERRFNELYGASKRRLRNPTDLERFANACTGLQAVRYGERRRPGARSCDYVIEPRVADAPYRTGDRATFPYKQSQTALAPELSH